MSEYRRFVAYFDEYIDGKKQGNAGFAKVELRNGLWRFFLRLTVGSCPVPPIQVYGFVREEGRLLGLPLGTIRPVQQIAEEWAFQDDAPLGEGKHKPGELSGIWIESGDGRCFVSAWDAEEIDAERFVTEAEAEAAEKKAAEKAGAGEAKETMETEELEAEVSEEEPGAEEAEDEAVEIEAAQVELEADASGMDAAEESEVQKDEAVEMEELETEAPEEEAEAEEAEDEAVETEMPADSGGSEENDTDGSEALETEAEEDGDVTQKDVTEESITEHGMTVIEELLQKRASFQPFPDGVIESCVMILPCDIARLQQENWQVGRSSFLQHGFYQYRHLLLGRAGDGTYILGVPGIDNPQEEYMAQMFGYEQFRRSARRDSDRNFGYWCRELRQI